MHKKKHMHRKNAKLYCKQGLLSLVLLIVTLYLGLSSSITQSLFPPAVDQLSDIISDKSVHRSRFIKIQCSRLYYTGYDNRKDSKVTGHYYYALQDNRCFFFLIDNNGDAAPKQTLTNYKGTFQLNQDERLYRELTSSLAKDMDWASESLRSISQPFILSQPDYHFLPMVLYALMLLACTIIFTISVIINFSRYRRCRKHTHHAEHRSRTRRPAAF